MMDLDEKKSDTKTNEGLPVKASQKKVRESSGYD